MEPKHAQRRYDLDWLRVLAFGGVFLYHCARFFNSNDWEMKNATTSPLVDVVTGIFELWGMPLLFAVSGASIFFALRPGGAVRFLSERMRRLLAPLVFGILVLGPPQVYLARLTHGDFEGSFFQFLPLYFDGNPFNGNFAWTGVHLWYLEYLLLFTLALAPLFVWLKRPSGLRVLAGISRFSVRPGAIFLWVLPFVALLSLMDPLGLLGPSATEAAARLMYLPFPLLGYLIYADGSIQQAIIRQRRAALALALALTPAMPLITVGIEEWGWVLGIAGYMLVMTLGGLIIWTYLLAFFGYAMRYLTANRPLLAYANQAVLPFYVLHQPVILLIGYFVIPLALPIAVKYLIIAPPAFGITLGLYEYGVRRVNLLRFFFGLKPRQAAKPSLAQPDRTGLAAQGVEEGGRGQYGWR